MGFFNKLFGNSEPETIISIPEKWSILQSKNNGMLMIIRKNAGLDKIAGHSSYAIRCGIAFALLNPDQNGLPQISVEPELDNLENDIFDFYEKDLSSIVSVIITTSGFREFVLYSKNIDEFKSRLEILKQKYPQYELTSYSEIDKNWTMYKSFK